jgi:hypothetical protein
MLGFSSMKSEIILAINGNKQLTDAILSEEFNVDKKFEYEFSSLTNADAYIDLPISKISPISKIISSSTGQLKIKIDHLSGICETFTTGVGYWSLDSIYSSNISGVAIGTNSVAGVDGFISLVKLV